MKAIIAIIIIVLLGWLIFWYAKRDNTPEVNTGIPTVEDNSAVYGTSTDNTGPYEDKG